MSSKTSGTWSVFAYASEHATITSPARHWRTRSDRRLSKGGRRKRRAASHGPFFPGNADRPGARLPRASTGPESVLPRLPTRPAEPARPEAPETPHKFAPPGARQRHVRQHLSAATHDPPAQLDSSPDTTRPAVHCASPLAARGTDSQ